MTHRSIPGPVLNCVGEETVSHCSHKRRVLARYVLAVDHRENLPQITPEDAQQAIKFPDDPTDSEHRGAAMSRVEKPEASWRVFTLAQIVSSR